jgi:hypothetical protein
MACPSSSSLECELLYCVPRARATIPPSRVNALNGDATITHFTAGEDGRLVYEAVYLGPYETGAFGVFLVLWNLDTTEQFKTQHDTLRKYMG